ncbi:MAG: sialidase family protein [Dongiaceae bacterium]
MKLILTPEGGLQPQALVDGQGTLHLVFLKGDPKACDVNYTRRAAGRTNFSAPLRVNSEPGSAIAVGTIRGAQFALGRNGRVHVAWNGAGSKKSERGAPMLYARLNDAGDAFEPQRDLMTATMHLDGGGSVAADGAGHVYVVWHAAPVEGPKGEQNRGVFMAKSADDGRTFTEERKINPTATGACGCCGLKALADPRGRLSVLYRAASGGMDRDVTLLLSKDQGKTFMSTVLDQWRVPTCPMSSMTLYSSGPDSLMALWDTKGQVLRSNIAADTAKASAPQAPSGRGAGRKHPVLAEGGKGGRLQLTAWTEGTGWQKGGAVAWELADLDAGTRASGRADGVPVWGKVAAVADADGTFTIFY